MTRYTIEKGVGGWFVHDAEDESEPYGPIKRKADAEREAKDLERNHTCRRGAQVWMKNPVAADREASPEVMFCGHCRRWFGFPEHVDIPRTMNVDSVNAFLREVDRRQHWYAELDDELPTVPANSNRPLTTRGDCPHDTTHVVTVTTSVPVDGEVREHVDHRTFCSACNKLRGLECIDGR